jgi:hypothetical protein
MEAHAQQLLAVADRLPTTANNKQSVSTTPGEQDGNGTMSGRDVSLNSTAVMSATRTVVTLHKPHRRSISKTDRRDAKDRVNVRRGRDEAADALGFKALQPLFVGFDYTTEAEYALSARCSKASKGSHCGRKSVMAS